MNVSPGIFLHRKFVVFEERVGVGALRYLAALWGHCQMRCKGQDLGRVEPAHIEELCGWKGAKGELWSALTAKERWHTPWVLVRRNGHVIVCGWAEWNFGLITRWKNGRKGGRPKKPDRNQPDTSRIPAANLKQTYEGNEGNEEKEGKEGKECASAPSTFVEWPTKEEWTVTAMQQGLTAEQAEAEWEYQESLVPARRWHNVDRTRLAYYARRVLRRWQEQHGGGQKKPAAGPAPSKTAAELRHEAWGWEQMGNKDKAAQLRDQAQKLDPL